jgi:zona occludens toxin
MITLITGAPGSGKTLYTVDKLLRGLIGTTVKGQDDDGNPVEYPRTVFSNINGLLLDHELIDAQWLSDLHQNKKTGAVVVYDEVQRVWPNRPAGSKKPAAVEYLETHRHDGIDLIIMTQNPQLLDPAVRALVGRHLHMRRVGSFGAAVVYEWDACSNSLNYKAAFTKTGYRYSSSAQKLYHSAKVHTKQTRKLPFVVWLMLAAVVGAAYMWPTLFDRLTGKGAQVAQSNPVTAHVAPQSRPTASPVVAQAMREKLGLTSPSKDQASSVPAPVQPEPVLAGCAVARARCVCFDTTGALMPEPKGACERVGGLLDAPLTLADPEPLPRPSNDLEADYAMIRATTKRQPLPSIRF